MKASVALTDRPPNWLKEALPGIITAALVGGAISAFGVYQAQAIATERTARNTEDIAHLTASVDTLGTDLTAVRVDVSWIRGRLEKTVP